MQGKAWLVVLLIIIIVAAIFYIVHYLTAPKAPVQKMRPGESFQQLLGEPPSQQTPSTPTAPQGKGY